MKKENGIMAVMLFMLLLLSRLIPHPTNFSALMAVALFSGSYWKKSQMRFVIPFVVMGITDLYFGFYPGIALNYMAIALGVLMAPSLQSSLWKIIERSVLSSAVFFLVSNFGVWWSAGLYAATPDGLWQCYMMALPFYQNSLVSTLFYSIFMYGTYRLVLGEQGFEGFLKLNYGRSK